MTRADSPALLVDIACDYLCSVLAGQPIFAETVADNYGPERVARGMGTLLVFLVTDAARRTETSAESIVETMRETYAHEAEGERA